MSTSSRGHKRETLLPHLEQLYGVAQVLTLNSEEAADLVQETYRRAFAREDAPETTAATRGYLLSLMHGIRSERMGAAAEAGPSDGSALRRHLAEQYVDRGMPFAFSTLPTDQRLLLVLREAENLSVEEIASVVDESAELVRSTLEAARSNLLSALRAGATELERHLLDEELQPDWRPAALERMRQEVFPPLPPTLRPAVSAHLRPEQAADSGRPAEAEEPSSDGKHDRNRWGAALRRALAVAAIITMAGLIGYGAQLLVREDPEVNLIDLTVARASGIEVTFRTDSPAQAERFVQDRFGERLVLPEIEGASLVGVGITQLVNDLEVAAFIYRDAQTNERLILYALSYAFLDRNEERIELERDVLRQIEEAGHFNLFDLREQRILVWRNRDDIFVAVVPPEVADLRERIVFPS